MSADERAIDELPRSEVGLQRASIRERARADSATRTNEGGEERGRASGDYFVPWNSTTTRMMRTTTTLLPGEGIPTRAFHFAIVAG